MDDTNLDAKLTSAASQALEELVTEYRNQILVFAKESAERLTGEIREIAVHDILRGINQTSKQRIGGYPTLIERFMNIYLITGVAIGAVGLLYFIFENVYSGMDLKERLPILISVIGFSIAALSFISLRLLSSRHRAWKLQEKYESPEIQNLSSDFLGLWRKVELTIRDIIVTSLGESAAKEPISAQIKRLVELNVLSESESMLVLDLLKYRNKFMHTGKPISKEQIITSIKGAELLLKEFKTF